MNFASATIATTPIAQTWQTPAWAIALLLLGLVLSVLGNVTLYLARRSDSSAQQARASEHEADEAKRDIILVEIRHVREDLGKIEHRLVSGEAQFAALHKRDREIELRVEREFAMLTAKLDSIERDVKSLKGDRHAA